MKRLIASSDRIGIHFVDENGECINNTVVKPYEFIVKLNLDEFKIVDELFGEEVES